jgi:hypothetical protein
MQPLTQFNPNVLWDEKSVAQYLGVSVEFLQQDRHGKKRIPFVKIGRAVRYDPGDVLAFKDRAKVRATEQR